MMELRLVRYYISIEWLRVTIGLLLVLTAVSLNLLVGNLAIVEAESTNQPLLADLTTVSESPLAPGQESFAIQLETETALTKALEAHEDKVAAVKRYLSARSAPLAGFAEELVTLSENNGLDWRLLAAISVVESSGGIHIPYNSYNAWGWAVYTGTKSGAAWGSWPHAIGSIAKGIRDGYSRRGLRSPEQMNARYAADKNWGFKVAREMAKISPYH